MYSRSLGILSFLCIYNRPFKPSPFAFHLRSYVSHPGSSRETRTECLQFPCGIVYCQSRPFTSFFIFKWKGTTCILQTPPEPGFSKSLDSLIIFFSGLFLLLLSSLLFHFSLSFSPPPSFFLLPSSCLCLSLPLILSPFLSFYSYDCISLTISLEWLEFVWAMLINK